MTMWVMLILISGAMVLLPGSTQKAAAATDTFYSEAALDGEIRSYADWGGGGMTYQGALNGAEPAAIQALPSGNTATVGQRNYTSEGFTFIFRAYFTFNTSTIPNDVEVLSATATFRVYEVFDDDAFDIFAYSIDYGTALTSSDWTTAPTGLVGTLFSSSDTSGGEYRSIQLSPSHIKTDNTTQITLRTSNEGSDPTSFEYATIYTAETTSAPYMVVNTITPTGATVTYNFTAAGMTNRTITTYPVEIIDWNNTHEQLRYEIYSANETWLNFSVDSNFTFQSISPYANVTDYGTGYYNITETYDNTYYHLWFLKEKDILYTTFHLTLWAPGSYSDLPYLGYPWEAWKVYYSTGTSFNATNATQIPDPTFDLPMGYNYTFAVLDHFNAVMATQTAVANVNERFISISVPAYELAISSLSSEDVRIQIYTTSNMSADPITIQVPANGNRYRYLRPTNYTIVATFIQSQSAVYFNRTVSEPLILRINGTTLEELVTLSNNIFSWQTVIVNKLTPGLILNTTNQPFKPDGTRAGEGRDTDPLFLDPYQIMWGTVQVNRTSLADGAKSLWAGHLNTSLMAGSVTVLEDTLFIAGTNSSASLMVNTSTGTNIINESAPPGKTYDILGDYAAYAGANLTVWTNASGLIVERNIRFRWTGSFTWYLDDNTNKLYTAIKVNNTLPLKIWRPYVSVAFYPGINISLSTVSVYDVDSAQYLDPTVNYNVDATGISFEFGNLSAGEERTFSIVCYKEEAQWDSSSYGTPTIRMDSPEYLEYQPGDYRYYVHGEWMNTYPAEYTGDIVILVEADREIDPASVIVYDIINERTIPDTEWYMNGDAIIIMSSSVIPISPSDKAAYGVYFLYKSDTSIEAYLGPALYVGDIPIPAALLPLILGAVLLMWGTLLDPRSDASKRNVLMITGGATVILTIMSIILLILIGYSQAASETAAVILSTAPVLP